MIDITQYDIARTLLWGSGRIPSNRRFPSWVPSFIRPAFDGWRKQAPVADPRIEVLVSMVFDLLMEVEALRTAELASNGGEPNSDSNYARAYRDTAYLTHDATGPSGGLEKLLGRFYPTQTGQVSGASGRKRTWRECVMLLRAGFSQEQVRAYKEAAERAETFT